MDYVVLGKSGVKVSKIGLGVWQASAEWKGDDEAIIRRYGDPTNWALTSSTPLRPMETGTARRS